jgi:hypothetical protein
MSLKLKMITGGVATAGAAASIAFAPIAAADSVTNAIDDLENQGYDVQINWTNV